MLFLLLHFELWYSTLRDRVEMDLPFLPRPLFLSHWPALTSLLHFFFPISMFLRHCPSHLTAVPIFFFPVLQLPSLHPVPLAFMLRIKVASHFCYLLPQPQFNSISTYLLIPHHYLPAWYIFSNHNHIFFSIIFST